MLFTGPLSGLLALAGLAAAFPANIMERVQSDPELTRRTLEILQERQNPGAPQVPEDFSEDQLIDVTGAHAFVPPGPKDNRGPCPGLNAFANHGYLPHNGYATTAQFVDATMNVVGMGFQLAGFLSLLGSTIDGSGTAWSIGGTPDPSTYSAAQAPLGPGNGISGSHNKYESDVSPTRPDLYQEGNNYKVKVSQFQQMFDTQPNAATANYDIQVLTDFRKKRFDTQIATNPYFFNGPFSGVLVQPAAYTFIYRFMANHSAANPEGTLNQDVLKSWFAITGKSGSFKWTEGYERIPANWYRRSLNVPYEVEYFLADVAYAAAKYPEFLDIGGNTGTPNSFTGISVTNFTGGLMNSEDLLQGNKFACLAYQYAAQVSPDILLGKNTNILDYVSQISSKLSCPQLDKFDESLLKQFPGYKRS